jgi:hypothetical protein
MNAIGHMIGKSFDRRVHGRKTKQEEISYTFLLGAPDEPNIRATIEKYKRAGWDYAARKEEEGFFGFGARTVLTFQR